MQSIQRFLKEIDAVFSNQTFKKMIFKKAVEAKEAIKVSFMAIGLVFILPVVFTVRFLKFLKE